MTFKGLKAIHSPQTGIIDWGYVARHFGMMYQQHGGKIVVSFEASEFLASTNPEYPIRITSKNQVCFSIVIEVEVVEKCLKFSFL